VVPAGGVESYDYRWFLEHFSNLRYLPRYQQNIDTPRKPLMGGLLS